MVTPQIIKYVGTATNETQFTGRDKVWQNGQAELTPQDVAQKLTAARSPFGSWVGGHRADLRNTVPGERSQFEYKPTGQVSQSSASALTRQNLFALPVPVVAARVRFFEWYANTTGMRASLAWLDDPANALSGSLTHTRMTFGGVNTFDIAAPTANSGLTASGVKYVESDIIQVASVPVSPSVLVKGRVPGAIANIRVAQNAQAVSRYDYPANPQFAKSGVELSFVLNVDAVATPSLYTGATSALNGSVCEVVGYTAQDCRTFLGGGASTQNGFLDDDGTALGWAGRACARISELNVSHVNMGWAGRTSENSFNVAVEALTRVRPNAATFSAFSLNDPDVGTPAGDARQLALAVRWIEANLALGSKPYISTTQANTNAATAANASRIAHNNAMRAYAAAGMCGIIDLDAYYTPNGVWLDPTWTPDQQHISSAGLRAGEAWFASQVLAAVA